jgi:hypothetical protein
VCTNVPRSAALRGALSQLSPPSDAAPERPRVPLGSAQRFERFVADAAPERPRVPLSSAQRFERFSDLLQLVFVRGTRRQLSPRERPV